MGSTLETVVFYFLAAFIIAMSIMTVTTQRIVRSATYLLFVRALRHGRHLFPAGLHFLGFCPNYGLCRWYRRSLCILHSADQWRG